MPSGLMKGWGKDGLRCHDLVTCASPDLPVAAAMELGSLADIRSAGKGGQDPSGLGPSQVASDIMWSDPVREEGLQVSDLLFRCRILLLCWTTAHCFSFSPLPIAVLRFKALQDDADYPLLMVALAQFNGERGIGLMFGPDQTQDFLEANGLSLVLRSHEGPDARSRPHRSMPLMDPGYSVDHRVPAGCLMTVFSAPDYPQARSRLSHEAGSFAGEKGLGEVLFGTEGIQRLFAPQSFWAV